ncbi:hypothetical protein K438DRAFT_1946609 [Mycena galopus ATCC 62051]|nr:hypothetical protein K438DRAFT_1946609 [Mycena galopus ATCC 62051]
MDGSGNGNGRDSAETASSGEEGKAERRHGTRGANGSQWKHSKKETKSQVHPSKEKIKQKKKRNEEKAKWKSKKPHVPPTLSNAVARRLWLVRSMHPQPASDVQPLLPPRGYHFFVLVDVVGAEVPGRNSQSIRPIAKKNTKGGAKLLFPLALDAASTPSTPSASTRPTAIRRRRRVALPVDAEPVSALRPPPACPCPCPCVELDGELGQYARDDGEGEGATPAQWRGQTRKGGQVADGLEARAIRGRRQAILEMKALSTSSRAGLPDA